MKKRWKPKDGEKFWFVDGFLEVDDSTYESEFYEFDKICAKFGNCFRTEAEAQAALKRVKKALRGEK